MIYNCNRLRVQSLKFIRALKLAKRAWIEIKNKIMKKS